MVYPTIICRKIGSDNDAGGPPAGLPAEKVPRLLPESSVRASEKGHWGGLVRVLDKGPVLFVQIGDEELEILLTEEQAARADSLRTLQELMSFLDDLDPDG